MSSESIMQSDEELPWSGLAIAGFVLGVVGFVVPFASLIGVILSSIALNYVSKTRKRGKALAGWGLALGLISMLIGAIGGVMTATQL